MSVDSTLSMEQKLGEDVKLGQKYWGFLLVPGSRSRSKTAQDMSGLSGFSARLERSYKKNRLKPTKRPGKVMWPRVDIHKPKMLFLNFPTPKKLIIQLPASNVWKNANHTIFIQFQKTIVKRFNLVSPAVWTKYNSLVMKNNYFYFFFEKNGYHTISIYENCMITIFSWKARFSEIVQTY